MKKRFISESIIPIAGEMFGNSIDVGEPILPSKFTWRDTEYTIKEILEKRKETSPCRHSGKEQYLRKHWFTIRTTDGSEMTIYFERQPKSSIRHNKRWWLYTISKQDDK